MLRLLGVRGHCHELGNESAEQVQEPDHIMLPGRVGNGGFASISGIANDAPLPALAICMFHCEATTGSPQERSAANSSRCNNQSDLADLV